MMNIKYCLKIALLTIPLLIFSSVFATKPDRQRQDTNLFAEDATTPEPDWRKQNANLSAQEANTAAQNAETAAKNAETAAKNANTNAKISNTAAQEANTMIKMLTPVPAPKEVTSAPNGYISCSFVEAGWSKDVWIPKHRVCKYLPSPEGVAWVEGYWSCTKQKHVDNMTGMCITWKWNPGHWLKTLQDY